LRLFEINTRLHCDHFDEIADIELEFLASLGFDSIWLMGVWRISEAARRISKIISPDFEGSPYAVPAYDINPLLGGLPAFRRLVDRAHHFNLAVIVDFVSNHLALDSPLIAEDPGFFIGNNNAARPQNTAEFFLHPSGEVIAFGKDPFFPPWNDTAQLDYTNPALRARMTEELTRIAGIADGVRCDMAMLVLRDQIRRQWYPNMPDEWFNQRMPGEFWSEAIANARRANRSFITIAEVYWDKEDQLMDLGFDLCYEKKLYDGLVWRNAPLVRDRLMRPDLRLRRSLTFVENHDEPRAASLFNETENLAALALILSLPGSSLIHEGQMDGFRERVPVQLARRPAKEDSNPSLRAGYERIARATCAGVFRTGAHEWIETAASSVAGFIRRDSASLIAYFGQVAGLAQRFGETSLDASALFRGFGFPQSLRLVSLLNRELQMVVYPGHFVPAPLLSSHEDRFLLVEAIST
jgi:glycosidase